MHRVNSLTSKMEIVGFLAAENGFTRYLELCTPTTGSSYWMLDRRILTTAHRLMYNGPAVFDDGFPIDFCTEGFDISQCLAQIKSKGLYYDIILVDPWHEYSTSIRDLRAAFGLIKDSGMIVVHDCTPPNAKIAAPEFTPGAWCGVTYKAYLDFVGGRHDLDYRTVDVDYGCGIVRKRKRSWWRRFIAENSRGHAERRQYRLLWKQWHEIGNDFERTYYFFEKHKKELLNLISVDEFFAALLKAQAP